MINPEFPKKNTECCAYDSDGLYLKINALICYQFA